MDNNVETNRTELSGAIISLPEYSHKSYGEIFYAMTVGVHRKSGYCDIIPVIISERLIWDTELTEGDAVQIIGQIRTYNEIIDGKNRLNIVVFAREFILAGEEAGDINKVYLEGYLCKPPVRRVSPLGREICDIMLAVNRMYNKSDYIPCIAWGRNAVYAGGLCVGTKIRISGRIQSREYRKRQEDGELITRTAYEVSIIRMEE
ncbi:MAG: single-stranded DNA-binding protein [Anaerovoracaceae bacterium]